MTTGAWFGRWIWGGAAALVLCAGLSSAPAGARTLHRGQRGGDPAFEEGPGGGARAQQAEAARKRLEERVLRKWVGLEGDALERARAVLAKHAEEKARLRKQMRRAMRKMRGLLMAEVDDDAAYRKAVDAFRDAAQKLQAIRQQEFDELAKILTPRQQARLLLALGKLARERRHRPPAEPGKGWRRPRPGGAPPPP